MGLNHGVFLKTCIFPRCDIPVSASAVVCFLKFVWMLPDEPSCIDEAAEGKLLACACRDAPTPAQPKLLPGSVETIDFAQQHAGSFVFGGGSEPSSNGGGGSNTMAMEL